MSRAAISVEGFIANELEIREVTNHRVVDVSVPHTPRKRDEAGEWVDAGPTTWFRAAFWDEHADAVLQSVGKGDLVTLTGGIEAKAWTSSEKTGVNVTVTFPVIARVVRRPKRGEPVSQEQWAAEQQQTWDSSTVEFANDETPF